MNNVLLIFMLIPLFLPLIHSFRRDDIWERMLCYASLSTRVALVLIVFSRAAHDSMISLVAVILLCVGNSGLLLLANVMKALEDECD